MEFRILGPVEVVEDGTSLPLGGPRQRALLTLLLLRANEPVSTERLIDELWGSDTPASGPTAVQNQIARLRKVLGPDRVQTRQSGYAIRVEPGELDLDSFGELVARAETAGAEERSTLLSEAAGLWRGAALTGLPDAPFVAPESARLDALRLAALEDRIDADLELGRHADLVAELSSLAARYPLQERLRGQLMLALYRSGRQAEALDVYRETRRLLADELGLDPSQSLRDLERAILAQDPALDPPPKQAKRAVVVPAAVSGEVQPRRHRARIAVAALALGVVAAAGALTAHALTSEREATSAPPPTTAPATGHTTSPITSTTPRPKPKHHKVNLAASTGTQAVTTTQAPATTSTPRPDSTTQPATVTVEKPRVSLPVTVTTAPNPRLATTAATTTRPATKTAAKPKLPRIADDFSSPALDTAIWRPFTDGTGSDVTQSAGQVSVAIAADATPGGPDNAVGGRITTQCTFPGDFDARVDFTLFAWPSAGNVRAGLEAFFAGGFVARTSSASSGDAYTASVGSRNATVPLDETAGSLRIARVGKTMTTYFWRNGQWVPLASGPSSGAAVLGLEATSSADFGHAEARVAFDNFSVVSTKPFCPAGSAPPGA